MSLRLLVVAGLARAAAAAAAAGDVAGPARAAAAAQNVWLSNGRLALAVSPASNGTDARLAFLGASNASDNALVDADEDALWELQLATPEGVVKASSRDSRRGNQTARCLQDAFYFVRRGPSDQVGNHTGDAREATITKVAEDEILVEWRAALALNASTDDSADAAYAVTLSISLPPGAATATLQWNVSNVDPTAPLGLWALTCAVGARGTPGDEVFYPQGFGVSKRDAIEGVPGATSSTVWIFRGRVAAAPRLRRGYSEEATRGNATWNFGRDRRTPQVLRHVGGGAE